MIIHIITILIIETALMITSDGKNSNDDDIIILGPVATAND